MTAARWGLFAIGRRFSSSAVSDQFIDYAIRSCKGKHDQALDVLRSGLSVAAQGSLESSRLHLALAEINLDACNLADAAAHAAQAKSALKALQPSQHLQSLQSYCSMLSVKALLMQGEDQEACQQAMLAATNSQGGPMEVQAQSQGLLLATSLSAEGRKQLPTERVSSAASSLASAIGSQPSVSGREGTVMPLHQLGLWYLSKGKLSEAEIQFKAAAQGAAAARDAAAAQSAPVISELHWTEVEASALLGSAQVSIARQDWSVAEDSLSKALKAAEGVSTEQHPRVAAVLLLLGKVYARTARIMFAEGLYRESSKLLKLDPTGNKPQVHGLVHPSLAAMLAWQFHQLLTTLPNRDNEAQAWAGCARQIWPKCGVPTDVSEIEAVLGASQHLKGKGDPGTGLAVCLDLRRGFEIAHE